MIRHRIGDYSHAIHRILLKPLPVLIRVNDEGAPMLDDHERRSLEAISGMLDRMVSDLGATLSLDQHRRLMSVSQCIGRLEAILDANPAPTEYVVLPLTDERRAALQEAIREHAAGWDVDSLPASLAEIGEVS